MDHPFAKSTSSVQNLKRLQAVVAPLDTLAILINADPDAMASALALKRLLWRKVKRVSIYRINHIKRADNLAFIGFLEVEQKHISHIKHSNISRWAIVDSQPQHHEKFMGYQFDIIIDHHPALPASRAGFVDIRKDYGATSTIMTEYLKAAKIVPSRRLATALFYGIKTDTANFVRECLPNDLRAFRYLHSLVNMNIIKKIESSEITKRMLSKFRFAIERLTFLDGVAYVHMDKVDTPDILVIIADFFMRVAEARWSVVSGVCDRKLVIIFRSAGLRADAGRMAQKLSDHWEGYGGGHAAAARAEIPLSKIGNETKGHLGLARLVKGRLKELIQ